MKWKFVVVVSFLLLLVAAVMRPVAGKKLVFEQRQGGDAANWGSDGFNNYPVTGGVVYAGAGYVPAGEQYITISYPGAYQYAPLVFVQAIGPVGVVVSNVGSTGFVVEIDQVLASAVVFHWLAVGE